MRGARLAATVLVCAFGAPVTVAAPGFDLEQLMAMLAQVDQSEVAFEETRHLALLSKPIVRRGTLHYVKPDQLEMRVVSPIQETTEIAGNRVRVESTDGTREWDLTRQPVALAWIEGIRASLAGDTATLTRQFRVTLKGLPAEWELHLEPSAASVAAALSRIDVRGRQTQLTSIEILDAQGDRISIAIAPKGKSAP
jgi:outer membrane lipoprotein-sorting protein